LDQKWLQNDLLRRASCLWLFFYEHLHFNYCQLNITTWHHCQPLCFHFLFHAYPEVRYLTTLVIYYCCLSVYEFKEVDCHLRAQPFPVSVLSCQRNSPPFMEFKSSLPHSQGPATIFCIKQDDSSPHIDTCLTSFMSVLILSSHLYIASQKGIFPSGFPTEI
jgi:hypothetical protein